MVALDEGRMLAREDFVEFLHQHHLDSFAKVMSFTGGKLLKELKLRSLTLLTLTRQGERVRVFLKRHQAVPFSRRVRSWLELAQPVSPGRQEWENVLALEKLGIRSLPLIAFGEGKRAGASFLLTAEISDACLAHLFVSQRFAAPVSPEAVAGKRLFIRRLAELARSFHNAGYDHRDFYLSHFFVKEVQGDFELRLIDLQRVEKRSGFRRHRLLKDLGALNYSAPGCITSVDRLRFYKWYRNIDKLTAQDKRFIRSTLRKTERIRAHDLKSRKRNQAQRQSALK